MTPADIYVVNFQNPEPKYYARVPNILDHLTYDDIDKKTGKKVIKRLSVYAIQLYRILRSIAGDHGVSWKNTKNLAEQSNMSIGAVSKAKEELQKNFHQLDGNALIIIQNKNKKKTQGGTTYHQIIITNIWSWNNGYMSTLKYHRSPPSSSPNETENPSSSPNETEPPVSGSPGETNKNNLNKNPLYEEEQPTAKPSVVFSNKKNRMFPSDDSSQIYSYLVKQKCHESTAYKISISCSLDDFKKALEYTIDMCRKKPKDNKWGYLQSVIKNKYWSKKNE